MLPSVLLLQILSMFKSLNFSTDAAYKSYTVFTVLFGLCVFIIRFVWNSYGMCPVFVRLISGYVTTRLLKDLKQMLCISGAGRLSVSY